MRAANRSTFTLALALFFVIGFYLGNVVELPEPGVSAETVRHPLVSEYPKYPPVDPSGATSAVSTGYTIGDNSYREIIEYGNDHYITLETVDGKALMPLIDGCPLFFIVTDKANLTKEDEKAILEQRGYWCEQILGHIDEISQMQPPKTFDRIEGKTDAEMVEINERRQENYENVSKHIEAQMEFLKSMEGYETKVGT